ncbi:MAG: SsrA-binding protein SmpB [Oscillospiraceae bacterium]|jgi:SsrA-binding protein|nr:SsrA-binding protein SmpB [Oscillospiraceae bacterium]
MKVGKAIKAVANNKKAWHDYFVEDSYEAGIELFGTEVKSIRQGGVSLKGAWCAVERGELFVKGLHVSPYEQGNIFNKDPLRVKRLLMHKREIIKILSIVKQKCYTIVPLSVYFKGSLVKISVGLCKGKKLYDKRQDIAEKTAKRATERAVKEFFR